MTRPVATGAEADGEPIRPKRVRVFFGREAELRFDATETARVVWSDVSGLSMREQPAIDWQSCYARFRRRAAALVLSDFSFMPFACYAWPRREIG